MEDKSPDLEILSLFQDLSCRAVLYKKCVIPVEATVIVLSSMPQIKALGRLPIRDWPVTVRKMKIRHDLKTDMNATATEKRSSLLLVIWHLVMLF